MARCVHEEAVPFMRKQYHLWPAGTGFDAWDVDRLISLSKELPVHPVTVDSVGEVDTVYWFDSSTGGPTVRAVVEHARLMLDADLSYPPISRTDRHPNGRRRWNSSGGCLRSTPGRCVSVPRA
jgi:hypothetical protein